ncbi:MAG: hypothetical protein WC657_09715, partial [Candidatus Paceibacterota bacterium]
SLTARSIRSASVSLVIVIVLLAKLHSLLHGDTADLADIHHSRTRFQLSVQNTPFCLSSSL